ncbi:hypothetical protein WA026_007741 [Henosepilachna vigintioctopunctata]|uniref:Uncharacterized protein n=1 Tax=Henosepilachna vigintioctopunctata TaxID=420089 RepID=A0AAW1TX89_9CUCU
MLVTGDYCYYLLFFLISVPPSLSISNGDSSEYDIQNVYQKGAHVVHEEVEMSNSDDIVYTNQLYIKDLRKKLHESSSSKHDDTDPYTVYDIIFLSYFALYVIFVIYVRFKTHHRVDYAEEDWSLLSLVTRYRKALAPEGTIEYDLKKSLESKLYANQSLIALAILWFGLSLCNYDEIFSDPKKHIEDIFGLVNAMVRYFLYILGVVYVFDVCLAAPYCYYK